MPPIDDLSNLPNADTQNAEMDKREAVEAAVQEFQMEAEKNRREEIVKDIPDGTQLDMGNQQIISKEDFITQAETELDRVARRAARKMERSGLTKDSPEVVNALKQSIAQRLPQLEAEWLSHKNKKAQRLEALELTGPNALTDEEKTAMQASIEENDRAMVVIASAWDETFKRKQELDNPTVEEAKEAVIETTAKE